MINAPKKLIVIGDSSVYGWGDDEGGGWCERLRLNFMNHPKAPIIYPLGIRGDGLENVAKRWKKEWETRGELRRKTPDGVMLSVGLNDTARVGAINGRPQLTSEAYKFGLYQLLKDIKKESKLFIIGLTPVIESSMPFAECLWYSNTSNSIYESKIEETCLELDVPFLATYKMMVKESNWQNLISKDGLHLNPKGHEWLYERMKKWVPFAEWSQMI
tara:strand:+ start:1198 stop:1845 length:648 start_codon:yes stop_codon:yes gene_type:complete